MSDTADLAALIGSRICHDLISPIGAISNGVELMMMNPNAASPELGLISESVASASARIKFFRIAFGLIQNEQRISRREVTGILKELSTNGRLRYVWDSPDDVQRRDVRLAFLLIQCLEVALPYSGDIAILTDGSRWQLRARSERIRSEPALWAMLDATPDPTRERQIPAAHAQFALVPRELHARGIKIVQTHSPEGVELSW